MPTVYGRIRGLQKPLNLDEPLRKADGAANGDAGGSFAYSQINPSSLWRIEHNLNAYPSVTVLNSAGDEEQGGVSYPDANTVEITWSAPFSGRAFLYT